MKLKKNITKITALAGSAAMALSAVAVPVSANLGDLPAPYVQDGQFQGKLVVGDNAAPQDVLGAIDIAAGFQAESVTPVTVSGGGSVSVEGGEDFQAYVGDQFTSGTDLNYKDLDGFLDDDVEVEDTDYDFEEVFDIENNAANRIAVSGITTYSEDENYEEDAFMELGNQQVSYRLDFDDTVDNIGTGDNEDTMDIEFLGRTIEVQNTQASNNEVTVETSSEYTLEEGDTVEVDGHTIELVRVGESSVLVSVDGQQKAISYGVEDNDATFDDADDFEVEVDSAFYEEGSDNNLAVLNLGSSLTESFQDGDALEIFGGTDDEDDATWVWKNDVPSDGELNSIGIELNIDHARQRSSPDSDERNAIALGEELELPNNRAALQFSAWEDSEMDEYEDVNLDFQNDDKENVEDLAGTEMSSATYDSADFDGKDYLVLEAENDAFELSITDNTGGSDGGTYTAEEVSLYATGSDIDGNDSSNNEVAVFMDDGEDEFFAGFLNPEDSDNFKVDSINYVAEDEDVAVEVNAKTDLGSAGVNVNEATQVSMDFDTSSWGASASSEYLAWAVRTESTGFTHFGSASDDASNAEAEDFKYNYDGSDKLTGTDDESRRTAYGVTWDDAEGMLDSDEFTLSAPAAGQEATLVVRTTDTQIMQDDGTSSSGAVEVNRAPVGLGVLSSEAESLLGDEPLVVVGGPFINSVASELLGNPTDAEIDQMFSPGMAKIRSFEDQQALLVAGYNAQDTVRASQVVANFNEYSDDLEGEEVELVFDGSDDVTFQEPSMDDSSDDSSSDDSSEDSDDSSEDSEQ